jgi:hypothetical protein
MAAEDPVSEPVDRRHSDLWHAFGRPDIVQRPLTNAGQLGWWRTWGRHKGHPCPVCGGVKHTEKCSEAEYPVATRS